MSKWTYLNLSKIFEIFKMAAILRSRRSFKPEVLPEVESYMKIGHAYLYLMSFCSTFYLKNWRSYDNFKIWPTFWPRDLVIWPLTYKKYTDLCWTRLHMWTKFRVNWSKIATCIASQTNRQTDRQTDKQTVKQHTCTNKQTNRQTNILANFFEILASNKLASKMNK